MPVIMWPVIFTVKGMLVLMLLLFSKHDDTFNENIFMHGTEAVFQIDGGYSVTFVKSIKMVNVSDKCDVNMSNDSV